MLRRSVGGVLLQWFAPPLLRFLSRSWRFERRGFAHFEAAESGDGFLIALWHGRMLPALPAHRDRDIYVLVSPSDDGSLVARMLHRYGFYVIRGSVSRTGARSLREMREHLRSGSGVVITPDGPRGPRHGMNIGLAWLARETGLPIVTISVACDRSWHLRSWDHFTIPKPGARIVLLYGEPLRVPPDADEERLEAITRTIGARLTELERSGFESLGIAPDW